MGFLVLQEKLNWMFDVFDQDGGGTISVEEIQDLLRLSILKSFLLTDLAMQGSL